MFTARLSRQRFLGAIVAAVATLPSLAAPRTANAAPPDQEQEHQAVLQAAWGHGWEYGVQHGKAITEQESAAVSVVTGALFDFLGYLTTRDEPITAGRDHTVYTLMDAYTAWANERGIGMCTPADVEHWQERLA